MNIVISNVFGSSNRGDGLLLDSLYASIRHTFGSDANVSGITHFPELEQKHIPAISWSNPPGRSYSDEKAVRRIQNLYRAMASLGYTWLGAPDAWPLASPPPPQRKSIQAMKNADLVISSAGGFLLDNNVSIYGSLMQLWIASQFGNPIILAPQTIGPIRSPRLQNLTHKVLSKASVICVREAYSYDFVTDTLGIDPLKVVRTTDIAFEYDQVDEVGGKTALKQLGIDPAKPFIGATVVDWEFPHHKSPSLSKRNCRDKMIEVFKRLNAKLDLPILLFNQVSSDLPLGEMIAAALPGIVVMDRQDRTTAVMRGMIAASAAFLGMRFHSCIFALLSNVPVYSIAYTHKSQGIMEDLGLGDLVADIDHFDVDETVQHIESLIADQEIYKNRIMEGKNQMHFPAFSTILEQFSKRTKL